MRSYVNQMFSYSMLLIRIYNLYLQKHQQKSGKKMDIVHSVLNEELRCLREKFNFYDIFAVKTVHENETVVYLTRQLSWVTKFRLDRGVSMHVKLSSRHYRRSPLVLQHAINSKECTTH